MLHPNPHCPLSAEDAILIHQTFNRLLRDIEEASGQFKQPNAKDKEMTNYLNGMHDAIYVLLNLLDVDVRNHQDELRDAAALSYAGLYHWLA